MRKHPLGRFLGLIVLYFAVIVGIFVLQFRSNTAVSKSLGDLTYTLFETRLSDGSLQPENRLRVSFKGMDFFCDDNTPLTAEDSAGNLLNLKLVSYAEAESSVSFSFADAATPGESNSYIDITFSQESNGDDTGLLVQIDYPLEASDTQISSQVNPPLVTIENVFIPYSINNDYTTEVISENNLRLTLNDETSEFISYAFTDNTIAFTREQNAARYSRYVPEEHFTFNAIGAEITGTGESAIQALYRNLRQSLVSNVSSALASQGTAGLSETEITAYVAELASQNRYNQALASIPASYSGSSSRTYMSSPFFGNLTSAMNGLASQTRRYESLLGAGSIDTLLADGISDYLLREKKSARVQNYIQAVAESVTELLPSVTAERAEETTSGDTRSQTTEASAQTLPALQAAAVINIYASLFENDQSLVSPLEALIAPCVDIIQSRCVFSDSTLRIFEEGSDTPLSINDTVFAGDALKKLGALTSRPSLTRAGNLLIYTVLSPSDLDASEIASLYRIIAADNEYFPHTEVLGWYGNTCVWAWTCAQSVTCIQNPSSVARITISFPANLAHYIIVSGVPDFQGQIEIHDLMYRTDPRFESYNSSGYVYQNASQTLLLKSVHRTQNELIRLFFPNSMVFEANTRN